MGLKRDCFQRQNWAIYYICDRNWSWKQAFSKLMSTLRKGNKSKKKIRGHFRLICTFIYLNTLPTWPWVEKGWRQTNNICLGCWNNFASAFLLTLFQVLVQYRPYPRQRAYHGFLRSFPLGLIHNCLYCIIILKYTRAFWQCFPRTV